MSSSKLYLWQNHLTPGGDSGVMIPSAWKIEYRNSAGEWAPVTGAASAYPLPVLNTAAPVASQPVVQANFDAVTTTAVRLVLDRVVFSGQRKATSVIEWEVWGVNAPVVEPEPEDPNAFLDSEPVAAAHAGGHARRCCPSRSGSSARTARCATSTCSGRRSRRPATPSAGEFEVVGDPAGYDGQTVAATVFVATTLSDVIESIDYSGRRSRRRASRPCCPIRCAPTYDDGTASSDVAVEWDADRRRQPTRTPMRSSTSRATVSGFEPGAIATVFVVEPLDQAEPIVAIEFDSAPQGTGWYTTAPTVTVTAEETASPVASIEYSLDGETWTPYTEPFAVVGAGRGHGERPGHERGRRGGRGIRDHQGRHDRPEHRHRLDRRGRQRRRTVTLTPTDDEPGSGVTRTVWSDGPDASPTGETNNMYATYEEPFSVQLTEEPRYVHVQAQDAAGNVEEHVTVELPARAGNSLDLEPMVTTRCVAGKVHLAVSVRNADDVVPTSR